MTNRFGTFEVPVDPRRVIVLEGRRDLEPAPRAGSGSIVVGSNALVDGQPPPFLDLNLAGVEILENFEPNLERLVARSLPLS